MLREFAFKKWIEVCKQAKENKNSNQSKSWNEFIRHNSKSRGSFVLGTCCSWMLSSRGVWFEWCLALKSED